MVKPTKKEDVAFQMYRKKDIDIDYINQTKKHPKFLEARKIEKALFDESDSILKQLLNARGDKELLSQRSAINKQMKELDKVLDPVKSAMNELDEAYTSKAIHEKRLADYRASSFFIKLKIQINPEARVLTTKTRDAEIKGDYAKAEGVFKARMGELTATCDKIKMETCVAEALQKVKPESPKSQSRSIGAAMTEEVARKGNLLCPRTASVPIDSAAASLTVERGRDLKSSMRITG